MYPQWNLGMKIEDIEKQIILYTLKYHSGNKTKTAHTLGLSIRTIDNKLDKYEAQKIPPAPKAEKPHENKSSTAD